jgi:hypothetical protein
MGEHDRIDEAVLALLHLGLHGGNKTSGLSLSWNIRLGSHEPPLCQGMIFDPVNKAKSVVLTEEGYRRCEELFWQLFGKAP